MEARAEGLGSRLGEADYFDPGKFTDHTKSVIREEAGSHPARSACGLHEYLLAHPKRVHGRGRFSACSGRFSRGPQTCSSRRAAAVKRTSPVTASSAT